MEVDEEPSASNASFRKLQHHLDANSDSSDTDSGQSDDSDTADVSDYIEFCPEGNRSGTVSSCVIWWTMLLFAALASHVLCNSSLANPEAEVSP